MWILPLKVYRHTTLGTLEKDHRSVQSTSYPQIKTHIVDLAVPVLQLESAARDMARGAARDVARDVACGTSRGAPPAVVHGEAPAEALAQAQ